MKITTIRTLICSLVLCVGVCRAADPAATRSLRLDQTNRPTTALNLTGPNVTLPVGDTPGTVLAADNPRVLAVADLAATAFNVVFIGDSTSYGFGATSNGGTTLPPTYPGVALTDLAAAGSGTWTGSNLGVVGKTAAAMAADVPGQVAALYNPGKINAAVVWAGKNDLGRSVSPADTAASVASICATCRAMGYAVVTVNMIQDQYYSETIRASFNALLAANPQTYGDELVDVTTAAPFAYGVPIDTTTVWYDGQHPNDAGYAVLGHLISPAIRRVGQRFVLGRRVVTQQGLARLDRREKSYTYTVPGGTLASGASGYVDVPIGGVFAAPSSLYNIELVGNSRTSSGPQWRQVKYMLCLYAGAIASVQSVTQTANNQSGGGSDASTWSFSYPDNNTLRVTFTAGSAGDSANFSLIDRGQ